MNASQLPPPTGPKDPTDDGARTEVAIPHLGGQDVLGWARTVWNERETWLRTRGGVESVFVAAQLLGCREDAVRWLRLRTRL